MKVLFNPNAVNFGSNYKINVTRNNHDSCIEAEDRFYFFQAHDFDNFKVHTFYPSKEELHKTDTLKHMLISASDRYDSIIESTLKQMNIDYHKQTRKEALDSKKVYKRTVLPMGYESYNLVGLDTAKVDNLYKKGNNDSENADNDFVDSYKYLREVDYLCSGQDIYAPKISLSEDENGEAKLSFIGGMCRYIVMKDKGINKIKFCMDDDSYKVAIKHNLISE